MIETQPIELTLPECERVIRWGIDLTSRAKIERGRRAFFLFALIAAAVIYGLLLPVASAFLMARDSLWWSILAIPAAILAILFLPWCIRSIREILGFSIKLSARQFQQRFKDNALGRYLLDPARISIAGEIVRSDFLWSDVEYYETLEDLTLISLKGDGNLIVIPRRTLASDADAQAMAELLRTKAKALDLEAWIAAHFERRQRNAS